ncbi:MAG TPA: YraN family protein [Candidatus Saccharimonadales bacterium]|nr:YraN family protein [Candidatus Saccharimonadales bacterium]
MKTTEQGRAAEVAVANQLKSQGYEIIAQNWRTRLCEIDIVAKKKKTIYFVEVKYRASSLQGDGFDHITARKLQQMTFAARNWVAENDWRGDYCLLAAAVSGIDASKIEMIEL